MEENQIDFKYPSYVQDILGPMCFDYGFGPFRWVCLSGKPEDLNKTDTIAMKVLQEIKENSPKRNSITNAGQHHLDQECAKKSISSGFSSTYSLC